MQMTLLWDVMSCLLVDVQGLLEETLASIFILRTAFIDRNSVNLLLFVTETRCVYCDLVKDFFLSHYLHWVPHTKRYIRPVFYISSCQLQLYKNTYLLTYLLLDPTTLWGSWPLKITDVHSSLSTAFCHHLLRFTSHRSSSTSPTISL